MGKKIDDSKKELAYILYMAGELQKDICTRVGITSKTLTKYITDDGWKIKRSAKNITRVELVNKALQSISNLLDESLKPENKDNDISDQLSKLAAFIERMDKKDNVVNDMATFISFSKRLQAWSDDDKEITPALMKLINKLQDKYITERISS